MPRQLSPKSHHNQRRRYRMTPIKFFLALSLFLATMQVQAQHNHQAHSSYAGMESRAIKSLSLDDIQELQRGGGWGLALPAELNGMPGPAHLLELKDKIPLSEEQTQKIQALFDDMREQAIRAGEKLIDAETAIEKAFASGKVQEAPLKALLSASEAARTELRFIHLSQHYKTVELLSADQIHRYNVLRGYTQDPCENIPEGHDPQMYRKHMGCK